MSKAWASIEERINFLASVDGASARKLDSHALCTEELAITPSISGAGRSNSEGLQVRSGLGDCPKRLLRIRVSAAYFDQRSTTVTRPRYGNPDFQNGDHRPTSFISESRLVPSKGGSDREKGKDGAIFGLVSEVHRDRR